MGLPSTRYWRSTFTGLTDELFFDGIETTSGIWPFRSQKIELEPIPEAERALRLIEAKRPLAQAAALVQGQSEGSRTSWMRIPSYAPSSPAGSKRPRPKAAKAAHEILYRHYAAAAPDLPDTLDEMQPLFHAVQHGVKAGSCAEAYDEVYSGADYRRQ